MVARSIPVIGLKGVMFSGKSTVAKDLVARYGYQRTRFAGPLKAMMTAFLTETGLPSSYIERMIEGDLKMVPSKYLGGRTPRYAMQTLGTEWGRDLMSLSLWIDAWANRVDALLSCGALIVVDDCRFAGEADVIRARGGLVIEVQNSSLRAANDDTAKHASEAMDFSPDRILHNDGVSMASLRVEVDAFMRAHAGELRLTA